MGYVSPEGEQWLSDGAAEHQEKLRAELWRLTDPTGDSHHTQDDVDKLRGEIAASEDGPAWLAQYDVEYAAAEADIVADTAGD